MLTELAELVWDAHCPSCGGVAVGMCAGCTAALRIEPAICTQASSEPELGDQTLAWVGPYEGVLRNAIIAAKERKALGMVAVLARLLAAVVAAMILAGGKLSPVVLVPVPTVRSRAIRRGIDLPEALARGAVHRLYQTGLDIRVVKGLRLARIPADQVGLTAAQRAQNVRGVFAWRGPPLSQRLIVVDDVLTTGATITQAMVACAAAGTPVLGGAVVARAFRRGNS